MTPRVSVVMPAYNAAEYVGEAIDSVLTQTFTDWELAVVDDGSTDSTPEIVAACDDPRIRLLAIEHSGLPAVARNRGIAATHAPYVAFLDADDLWLPEKLERQAAILDRRPEVGLVHTGLELLEDEEPRPFPPPDGLNVPGSQFERMASSSYIANSSVLLRRELLELYGSFDDDARLRGTEDFELYIRLSPHTLFAYVDEPLLRYRVTDGGVGRGLQMGLGYVTAMEKMQRLHPDLIATLGVPYFRFRGQRCCYFGLRGRGRRELLRVLRAEPRDTFAWKWLAYSFLPAAFVRRHLGLRERLLAQRRRGRGESIPAGRR